MTTTAPTTTQPPVTEGDGVIFFATRTSDWSGSNPVLLFDDTRVNIGQRFQDGFSFTANNSGLHFFSLSAGALAHTETILSLTDIKPARGNIRRESTANSGDDVIYRNTIVNLDRDQAITVEAMTVLASNGDDALISWGGFSFDDLFVDPVVFSAGRDSEYRPDSPTKHIIELPDVFVNQGDSFIEDSSQFKAPEDGIYYFTFSIGQINGDPARVALGVQRVTDADNEAEIICGQGNTNDLNIQSRSTVVQLEEGDLVWISTLNPSVYSDPDDYQTSLSGFKYSPSKASQVAWSVHRLWPWSGNPGVGFDPIEFTSVAVNVGEVYNEASDVFEISVSGYYFLEFNVGVLGGAEAGRPTYVKLIKGGEPENESNLGEVLASVVHEAVAENNDNVGRSLITLLEAGDVIRLAADENTGIFSDSERQTTFLGLLLLEV
ncbi:hypothetical protein CAPTEDRAFT_228528 [Capitella teleta]|uniref:C1q domain-containing protein n=1 Tax=Capitella teleta TaxID=283909 RepID=R7UL53_CAPTE|nr:hypothetical protein CAPTEDRAFT_228528 [Capitella teleta]|eukprot:ELU06838.1 hypothetical protein CAPTEDRAFT_228528 [Capitella teleta]